ncbi:LPD7 domain-containing protein, partial [Campylobacter sp. RM9328]
KILRQIQTEVAEILGMERGQDKRISKRERVEPRKYAQIKEQERKTQKELKAELEQEKLSKAELKKELEQLRKDSKDQGYTKEYFQEINREKKLLRFNTKNDFEKWVQELTEKHTKKSFWSDKVNNEAIFEDMYKSYQDQSNILQELEAKVKYLEAKNNNEETISTLKTDFKAKLFDEAYNDISKEVDLSRLYYNKEQKIIINKSQNWEIKDNNTQLVSKNFTPESVAIMIKLAQKKGWDLEQLEITGSKEFKAEVAKQIKEIKEQEKKAEIERARAEFEAQIQSILEQSKAEKEKIKRVHYNEIDEIITKKNQEIQAQNQEISAKNKRIQELETRLKQEQNKELEAESKQSLQENWKASEERQERILDKLDNQLKQEQQSQAQIDLNFINKIENQIFIDNNDDIYRLYSILGRYKLIEQQEYLKTKLREPMIATPNDYIRNAKEKILSTIKQENKPSLEDIENKEKELFLKVLSMTTKDMVKKDSEKQNQQRGWSR